MRRRDFLAAVSAAFIPWRLLAQISATTIPAGSQLPAAELSKMLLGKGKPPLIVQVGSKVFYGEAHIRGSVYAGPGSQPNGLKALDATVSSHAKGEEIVLYCGCCPWGHCPNVGPAFQHLQEKGYTNVKVLYMANNFGDDWASKGYPTDRK